jgi:phage repressor protein C with HTH and peptisase S24 domain
MTSQRYSGRPKKPSLLLVRRVVGKSMLPTLRPGRIVIASGLYGELHEDDVVIIYHRGLEKVKRIQIIRDGRLYVVGDNTAHSTDSSAFGWLDEEAVRAKVIWPRV